MDVQHAPGGPGGRARWTSSAKSGVGTALSSSGRVWFTVSHGILNEVYYPRVDQACVRDMEFIVTDGSQFFSEEKRHAQHVITNLSAGVPAFRLTNRCDHGRYQIEKEVLADPRREVVLQRIQFTALQGQLSDYHLFALMAPHLGNGGDGNTGWVGEFKGMPMLFAERDGIAVALMCSTAFAKRSVGFVGVSDGWTDLHSHRQMTWNYERAEKGNVALTGEIDLVASGGRFLVAMGFGRTFGEAAHRASASVWDGFDVAASKYAHDWRAWQKSLKPLGGSAPAKRDIYQVSTAVLRSHEAEGFPGGFIASLSIPWGFSKGDQDLGGYHLVWPRDLVESAGALLAAGDRESPRRVLRYLAVTQDADGHWPQNMWLDGTPYWNGIQMDETGFPILLVDLAKSEGVLEKGDLERLWPMVRKAAGYLVRNGPVTQQDRWEEDPGYSPFTLAVEVAALLCAAELADTYEPALALYLRETADAWNSAIERWTYVTNTALARQVGVDGYYIRIATPAQARAASPTRALVAVKSPPPGEGSGQIAQMVSPDALALVRFGLRAAHDPRIMNTVKVIDALLKVDMPGGPAWRRYDHDAYGEHQDGSPYDGSGRGRPWPLLTGERAHYELAAGRAVEAESLSGTLSSFAGEGGLLPEQIWDAADIPERELFFGKPSGSAMPLAWAHAEYVKLRRSLADGRVFDTPSHAAQRYQVEKVESKHTIWRFNNRCREIRLGNLLRVELLQSARVHWSLDGWRTSHDSVTRDTGLGSHVADLPTSKAPPGTHVQLTFHWQVSDRWEGTDFDLTVSQPAPAKGKAPGVRPRTSQRARP